MLQAMATSSQRMAATCAADKKKLTETALPSVVGGPTSNKSDSSSTQVAVRPFGAPTSFGGSVGGSNGGLAGSASNSGSSGSIVRQVNPWSLRPTDIPTSPSMPSNNAQLQYAMQQATAERLRQKISASQLEAARNLGARPSSQSLAAQAEASSGDEDDIDDEDDDDDDEEDDDDSSYGARQKPQMVKAGGAGMRRM